MPKRKHKGGPEITFDADARRSYLQGFSERKRQRRAYGLAMQKVKDRQEKLVERKERKQSLMEQIVQSEKAKEELLEGMLVGAEEEGEEEDCTDPAADTPDTKQSSQPPPEGGAQTKKYMDQETEKRWGGHVVVNISTSIPGDDDDDDDDSNNNKPRPAQEKPHQPRRRQADKAQVHAGSVDHFLSQTIKALPKHKKNHHRAQHKGKHGASEMKGVGGAAGLQAAQKFLKRSQDKKKDGKKRKR